MILYFIDGKIDCFETSKDYPQLENAYNIDAGDGPRNCYDQLIELKNEIQDKSNHVVISNFLPFLDLADEIYLYNKDEKTFINWKDIKFKVNPDGKSKMEIYLYFLL